VLYHDAWAVAGEGPGYTWTLDNPHTCAGIEQIVWQPRHRSRFDYVSIGSWGTHPMARALVEAAHLAFDRPVEGVWLSDHFGLV
jgi:hypothetical protein